MYVCIYYIKEEQLKVFILLLSLFGHAFQLLNDNNSFGQLSFLICKNSA